MRIIISPAKKMNQDTDSFLWRELPVFLPRTVLILERLRELSYQEKKSLWKCSDALAKLNAKRVEETDLFRNLTPAVFAYEGIQYQYMAPGVFTDQELEYAAEHLRILSSFYGILRPFDGVTPYRLEMCSKLSVEGCSNLYEFWGDALARNLSSETDCVVNLASKEYSISVSRNLPENFPCITVVFAEEQGQRLVEKGTMCKMARGEIVRFLAGNNICEPEGIKEFKGLGYQFAPKYSDQKTYTFIRPSVLSG